MWLGLDDIMLKKMLLAYYKGMYLDDTDVLIELTMDDLNIDENTWLSYMDYKKGSVQGTLTGVLTGAALGTALAGPVGGIVGAVAGAIGAEAGAEVRIVLSEKGKKELENNYKDEIYPFNIIGGDTEKGRGEDGRLYLKTTGMVQVYVACENCRTKEDKVNCTSCEKIIYYEESMLDEIYNKRYLATLGENDKYAESVLDYLKKCYTYTTVGATTKYDGEQSSTSYDIKDTEHNNDLTDAIKMYTTRTLKTTQSTWEYENETKERKESRERNLKPTEIFPIRAQYIQYSNKVAEYATPVEFMIDLLEIVESRDFINAFIETVGNDNYIKLKLYPTENTTTTSIEENKYRTTTITGKRVYDAEIIEYMPKGEENWIAGTGGARVTLNLVNYKDGDVKYVSAVLDDYETDGTKYKVRLYVNNQKYGEDVQLYYKDGLWFFDEDVTEHAWYMRMPSENSWTDESKVIETETTQTTETKYDIGIIQIKTWYATVTSNNLLNKQITVENLQGTENENEKVKLMDLTNVKDKNEYDPEELLGQALNVIFNSQKISYSDVTKNIPSDGNEGIFKITKLKNIESTYTNKIKRIVRVDRG